MKLSQNPRGKEDPTLGSTPAIEREFNLSQIIWGIDMGMSIEQIIDQIMEVLCR